MLVQLRYVENAGGLRLNKRKTFGVSARSMCGYSPILHL